MSSQNLEYLDLSQTLMSDVSPLANLQNLKTLDLERSEVEDLMRSQTYRT